MIRWFGAYTLIAGCLTRYMDPNRIVKTVRTGILDLISSDASTLQGMKKHKERNREAGKGYAEPKDAATDDRAALVARHVS